MEEPSKFHWGLRRHNGDENQAVSHLRLYVGNSRLVGGFITQVSQGEVMGSADAPGPSDARQDTERALLLNLTVILGIK